MPYLSIREAADDIRSWMTTPTELVEEALERIDELDGEIQAFITVLREQALVEAAKAEAEQRTGFIAARCMAFLLALRISSRSRMCARRLGLGCWRTMFRWRMRWWLSS